MLMMKEKTLIKCEQEHMTMITILTIVDTQNIKTIELSD